MLESAAPIPTSSSIRAIFWPTGGRPGTMQSPPIAPQDPEAYRDFTTKVIRFLAAEFRNRYPRTPILPALGNNDSYCGDYRITPDGPFASMFAAVWEPLLGLDQAHEGEAFRATFQRGGYYTIRLRQPAGHRVVVLNSVVFSQNYDNACGSSTHTPALDQLHWLAGTLEAPRRPGNPCGC